MSAASPIGTKSEFSRKRLLAASFDEDAAAELLAEMIKAHPPTPFTVSATQTVPVAAPSVYLQAKRPTPTASTVDASDLGEWMSEAGDRLEEFVSDVQESMRVHGYCVVSGVLEELICTAYVTHLNNAFSSIYDQRTGESLNMDFDRPLSLHGAGKWPPFKAKGMLNVHSTGSLKVMDMLRRDPRVRRVFEALHGTESPLIPSRDRVGAMAPDADGKSWNHVDADPRGSLSRPAEFQSMLILKQGDVRDQGFVCYPGSHKHFFRHARVDPNINSHKQGKDFYQVPDVALAAPGCARVLVRPPAGSVLLWDSRLIHCNSTGQKSPSRVGVGRIVAYLNFTPASKVSKEAWRKLRKAILKQKTTGHSVIKPAFQAPGYFGKKKYEHRYQDAYLSVYTEDTIPVALLPPITECGE